MKHTNKSTKTLLEFMYQNTAKWTDTFSSNIEENSQREVLFECVYIFLFWLQKAAHFKLSDTEAEELYLSITDSMIISIVDMIAPNMPVAQQNKQRLDLFSKIQLRQIQYAKHSRGKDVLDGSQKAILQIFTNAILPYRKVDVPDRERRIKYIAEQLFVDFLQNKLIMLEECITTAFEKKSEEG